MRCFLFFLMVILFSLNFTVGAQTQRQNTGWFLFLNNTKINKNWGAYLDMQLRTTDDYKKVRNLLFRPGLTYYLNPKQEITLGYLLNESYVYQPDLVDYHLTEHRIWEQYVYKHKIKAIAVNHRFRLEQRFIERYQAKDFFAQRFRYFFRLIIPLKKELKTFEKGAYLALQNEVFLNLQNKDELNKHVFDQNRAYGALGYRIDKKIDIEAGYLNQYSKGFANNSINNVIQVAVYTRF
jgi:hypothetical protein